MNSIFEILDDIRQGKMVVIMDDEDRENEGDLIMAASMVRPEDINFMARYARGLICLSLTRERCERLDLPLMVKHNNEKFATNFTVSIEAARGVTTGISAQDRAKTVQAAVNAGAQKEDIVQPGHVFPLMAQPGGVLTRAGHTEAGVDVARMAGLEPAAVLVEILNDDGSMARRPELEAFAIAHGLKIGTVASLIKHRLATEKTVHCIERQQVETDFGTFELFLYQDVVENDTHAVMVYGDLKSCVAPLIRVHLKNYLSDVLMVNRADLGMPLRVAMGEISRSGCGAIVVLGDHLEQETELAALLSASSAPKQKEIKAMSQSTQELRTYGIGAQILADLGVRKMRVLSAPKKFTGLAGFGLEVLEYVEPADITP